MAEKTVAEFLVDIEERHWNNIYFLNFWLLFEQAGTEIYLESK